MATPRFNRAYSRLVASFDRYRTAPRSQFEIPELGRRRLEMDEARSNMAAVRKSEGLRFRDAPTPDWVETKVGPETATRTGIISLTLTVMLIIVGGFAFLQMVQGFGSGDLSIDEDSVVSSVSETDQGCVWRIDFTVENSGEAEIRIESIQLSGRNTYVRVTDLDTLAPGTQAGLAWQRPLVGDCPASPPTESRLLEVSYTTSADTVIRSTSIQL